MGVGPRGRDPGPGRRDPDGWAALLPPVSTRRAGGSLRGGRGSLPAPRPPDPGASRARSSERPSPTNPRWRRPATAPRNGPARLWCQNGQAAAAPRGWPGPGFPPTFRAVPPGSGGQLRRARGERGARAGEGAGPGGGGARRGRGRQKGSGRWPLRSSCRGDKETGLAFDTTGTCPT